MVFRTLVNSAKRVPMIKFRKGGLPAASAVEKSQVQSKQTATPKISSSKSKGTVIEDWELPSRYWRKPMSDIEMDYINRGGPEFK